MLPRYALVLRVVEWGSKRSTVGQQEKIVPPAPSFLVKNKAGWPRAEPGNSTILPQPHYLVPSGEVEGEYLGFTYGWFYCWFLSAFAIRHRKTSWLTKSKELMFCALNDGKLFEPEHLEECAIRMELIFSGIALGVWRPFRFMIFSRKGEEKKGCMAWERASTVGKLNLGLLFFKALEDKADFLAYYK